MDKPYKRAFYILLSLCLIAVIPGVLFAGCTLIYRGLTENQELVRVTSPDGAIDAVLVKIGSLEGATGGSSVDLYLVPVEEDADELSASDRLLTADGLSDLDDDLELRWRGESVLEIRYRGALISDFQNHEYVRVENEERRTIELRLIPPENLGALPDVYYSDDAVVVDSRERTIPE